MAAAPIAAGEPIRKFGQIIGFAATDIAPGQWVHEHNCVLHDFQRDYRFGEDARAATMLPVEHQATFEGFRRANGKTGTRNYLGILTSVNCSATVARLIAREAEKRGLLDDYPDVDGVIPLVHGTGCGMAAKGEGFEALMRTQWGYAGNPNMGGVMMVGLGCEVFQIGRMKEEYGIVESELFHSLTIQATGGTRKTVEAGLERIKAMLPILNKATRETRPASELMLALQCGGSDGYSGITANPALGAAADMLVHQRRHGDPLGDAGDLRRRASAHPRAATPRDRREAGRADPLVGGLHRAQRRRDEQQPLARQQGRRADDDPREIARRRGQGRHDAAQRRLPIRRAGHGEGLRLHGHARLRSGFGDRAGGRRRERALLHHRPRLRLRLQADAVDQARHQHDDLPRMIEDMDINCGDVLDGVTIEDKGGRFSSTCSGRLRRARKSEALGYGDAEFAPWQIGATM